MMQWLVRKLRQSQDSSKATSHRRGTRRAIVMPERLEPRNAPGVMLPWLPILEMPADETATFGDVEQRDPYEVARDFLPISKTSPASFSTAARDLTFSEFRNDTTGESVEETVAEFAVINRISFSSDLQFAAGVAFDRIGSASLVSEELSTQLATLPAALTVTVAKEDSLRSTAPPAVATASSTVVAASSSSAGAATEVVVPSTHVRQTPVSKSSVATTPLPSEVSVFPTPEVTITEISSPDLTSAAEASPTHKSTTKEAVESTIVESPPEVVSEALAAPSIPTTATILEPQATSDDVSRPIVVVPTPSILSAIPKTSDAVISDSESKAIVVPEPIATHTSPAVPSQVAAESASTFAATIPAIFEATSETTTTAYKLISESDVDLLLSRAAQATASNDAIIAIVDRGGHILGVHVEQGVLDTITDEDTLVFAIDGAVAKARTAAFFSNNQAPLTSRTVRFISQSTITQREVQANPNVTEETLRGPGFVAPIGLGGHFPPDVLHTPHVDLFAIEHTNRDSLVHSGLNRIKETATVNVDGKITGKGGDDIFLGSRFGANFIEGQEIDAPESYGVVSGKLTSAQSRGIATLPGGVPLYKFNDETASPELIGGIGVFFPGPDGYADHEQGFVAGIGQNTGQRTNANLVLEAEYIAGLVAANATTIGGIEPVDEFTLQLGRIDLVGITLESLGPHPGRPEKFLNNMAAKFAEGAETGMRMPVIPSGATAIDGEAVPEGWLVSPAASSDGLLSAADVEKIILDGITEADLVRSAIRLPLGTRSKMVLAVADQEGEILGLFRMPDSTFFSIDVAVAKSRNVVYYADAGDLLSIDQVDFAGDGTPDIPAGTALTNRTFRYLAEPRFPSGVDGSTPPPFSILRDPGINPTTGENLGAPTPASSFTSVLGFDAFNPSSNFHEPVPTTGFQNGIVFFPGSSPLYNSAALVGGFGVSGDGVDQDDVVTFSGAGGFLPRRNTGVTRADEVFVDGVRLPYQKFLRNPRG